MMPGPNSTMLPTGNGHMTNRIPPSWSPENEHHYSFRSYMTNLTLWIMLTDLQPHQQCAAVITRLDGTARAIGRMMTTFEITQGGVVNGVMVDPVTYLTHALHQRFSNLEEEGRLQSMTEMLAFERRPGESINSLIARYERQFAREQQSKVSSSSAWRDVQSSCAEPSASEQTSCRTIFNPFKDDFPRQRTSSPNCAETCDW